MSEHSDTSITKEDELKATAFIVAVLFPAATIAFVGVYGFIVWMSHMILGPPTM